VDTPRAQNQFGSLVVCLPSAHAGGELAVRHDHREVKFDWSQDSKSIQWAAFYSDCEHEVLPVTSGYRVTLTYNLYYNKNGCQIPALSNWGSSSLPLYDVFSQALQSESFMPHGNVFLITFNQKVVFSEFIVITIMLMPRITPMPDSLL
jgi:2OG-Fe(II) oxygenase superfamily